MYHRSVAQTADSFRAASCQTAKIDYPPPSTAAHMGNDGLDHPKVAEQLCVEIEKEHHFVGGLYIVSHEAAGRSGGVDQDIDSAKFGDRRGDRRFH
jgi:hypothetical protein